MICFPDPGNTSVFADSGVVALNPPPSTTKSIPALSRSSVSFILLDTFAIDPSTKRLLSKGPLSVMIRSSSIISPSVTIGFVRSKIILWGSIVAIAETNKGIRAKNHTT